MAISVFKAFKSTVTAFVTAGIFATRRVLADPTTGAPVGILNDSGNGPDGIWTPIDITAAQAANPPAAMLADLNATYRLNVAPYTRFVSTGTSLSAYGGAGAGSDIIPAWMNEILYAPLTISNVDGLTVYGQLRIQNYPA